MAFDTTSWSTVLRARDGDSAVARAALEKLCTNYWPPLYIFLRGKGYAPELASEYTPSFFAHLLEKDCLSYVDRERGKFRTFLLVSLNRFLASEYAKQSAKKRNSGIPSISIDLLQAEERYGLEPSDPKTPETMYERQWALTVMRNALENLRREYEQAGNLARFNALKPYITVERKDGT